MAQEKKVWLITGVSRGFGLRLAERALERGDFVIGTTRDGRAPAVLAERANFTVLPLEVTDPRQAREAVRQASELHGRIDVLVNNAGYGLFGAVEDFSDEEIRRLFEVNFFGLLNVTRAALPILRKQRSGHIVNFSSVAGLTAGAGSGIYGASKFAVEGLSEALEQELSPLGIRVTLVEPGAFRTDFASEHSMRASGCITEEYRESAYANLAGLRARNGKQRGDPARAAEAILKAVSSDQPPLRLVLGEDSLMRTRAKLERLERDLAGWEEVTRSTDFTD